MSDGTPQKRIRASGEVLNFLISEFNKNQNPSPDRRKFISDKASMNEKAVRIWFQNRRAKQRKHERQSSTVLGGDLYNHQDHHITNNGNNISFYSTNSSISSSNDSLSSPSRLNSIEVNDNYCCIDSSSLSVGSWQRIKSGIHDENLLKNNLINLSPFTLNDIMQNVDLLVILSKKNHELNYFFSAISNGSKILFRIFYSLNSIINCSLHNNNSTNDENISGTTTYELKLNLNKQPKFSVYFFNGINSTTNQWSICDDFSEGQQVSQAFTDPINTFANQNNPSSNIPHVIVGTKHSLNYLCRYINENNVFNHNNQFGNFQSSNNFITANPSDVIAPLKHHSFDYDLNQSTNLQFTDPLYNPPNSSTSTASSSNFISSLPIDNFTNLTNSNFSSNNLSNNSSSITTMTNNTNTTNINESPFSVNSNQFYHSDTPQSTQSFQNLTTTHTTDNNNKLSGDININNIKSTTTPDEIFNQTKDLNSYTHHQQQPQQPNNIGEFDFSEFSGSHNNGIDSSNSLLTNPNLLNSIGVLTSPAHHQPTIDFIDFGN
ncbi:PHO2 [Candida pseudojiufengensis]|uniref:PHO2 n=1 Tax=Candida pseudojiufengensis TaxID=497109 RepID=UPI002225170A|nr:PHO2 [Candida pseudojiufengensis]KAI5964215.1 PHO2 [Candida pseudojiufengensis]